MSDKNQIFRQKSLDRINSPESLNEYLRVTSPGVWILLGAIIIIIAGIIAWACLGTIDSTVQVAVRSNGEKTICYVPENALESVIVNREIEIDGKAYELEPDVLEPTTITDNTNVYVLLAGNLEAGDIVYPVELGENLEKGVYSGEIVTEQITPIKFLVN